MITSLIVDDEAPARAQLARLLLAHPDIRVVAESTNGLEALEHIAEHRPDVLFLDIEMPGLNGFEVLNQVSEPPVTVFATAFDEYAIRAFDANAIDYVLKPIHAARLSQAIDKVRAALMAPMDAYRTVLRQALTAVTSHVPAKLVGRRGNRLVLLSPKDILYATIEDRLAFLHTATERFMTDRTVAELEALLAPSGFVRVSRSTIVNLHHARELLPWSSGTWKVRLANGTELDVSRDRARDLKTRLL